ncbi:hypothetical protein Hanom_Chr13g01240261 [Helianthus anomalus]
MMHKGKWEAIWGESGKQRRLKGFVDVRGDISRYNTNHWIFLLIKGQTLI